MKLPNLLIKTETACGFMPRIEAGMLPRARLEPSGTLTYTGMRPYCRRRLRNGRVRVFFRDRQGRKAGSVVTDAHLAALFVPRESYTIEQADG